MLAYNPNVIKDAYVAYADSARGKEYFKSLGFSFLHPVKQADKGSAKLPVSFIKPPGPTSSSSDYQGASRDIKSGGKSFKGTAPPVITMATSNILTYLTALVSMNTNSNLSPF